MRIWEPQYECMSRDELAQVQFERLQSTLNRVYRNVAFYRKQFNAINFEPGASVAKDAVILVIGK